MRGEQASELSTVKMTTITPVARRIQPVEQTECHVTPKFADLLGDEGRQEITAMFDGKEYERKGAAMPTTRVYKRIDNRSYQYVSRVNVRVNAILGNHVEGLRVYTGRAVITENNIFGNTCGLTNVSGSVTDATNNFWGNSLGPGPDPADQTCDLVSSVTLWEPAATAKFLIRGNQCE